MLKSGYYQNILEIEPTIDADLLDFGALANDTEIGTPAQNGKEVINTIKRELDSIKTTATNEGIKITANTGDISLLKQKTVHLNTSGQIDGTTINEKSANPASQIMVANAVKAGGGGGATNFSGLANDTGIGISPEFPQNGKGLMEQIGKDIGTLESDISNVDNDLDDFKLFQEQVEAFNNLEPPDLLRQEVIFGSNYQNTDYTQVIQMTVDKNEYPVKFPNKLTSRLIDYITISKDSLNFTEATYLFKNLFFIKLTNVKLSAGSNNLTGRFIFRIKDKDSNITNADEYDFKGKDNEIVQAFTSLNFIMIKEKAPYTVEVAFFLDESTISNAAGDPVNFEVISTATTGVDNHIIAGGSVDI